jgi:hypothetical protein
MGDLHARELHRLLKGLCRLDQGQHEMPLALLSYRNLAISCPAADLPQAGREVICDLGALWRARQMPRWLDRSFKREWDLFLVLEVNYFYPHRHGRWWPTSLSQTCMLLSDREHLANVIADGDISTAATLLLPRNDQFWGSIVPQEEVLPYKTAWARMRRALAILAGLIDQAGPLGPS